ncbi:MAG: 2-oxoacid:acceptor oxidoreductase subunit alpha [Planctomycetes bacterium]|nr:2-oxoacid:acceptor oxidoreductase subunit alpha [Planctomycetota bacterium]
MPSRETITNDVTIQVATINGTGSQSSNLVLTKALFHMGVPVGCKNMFPSNIMGLPTWYTIRVSRDGYLGRKKELNILAALNPNTWFEDVKQVWPGGAIVYEKKFSEAALVGLDPSITLYPVPFEALADKRIENAKLRRLLVNMIYVGVLTHLLDIDAQAVEETIAHQFQKKPKAIPSNVQAFRVGLEYARENLEKRDPFRVERVERTKDRIMIEGNAACALGAVWGGCTFIAWYPITPSSSLVESAIDYLKRYRHDRATGKATYAVVQAEDELAAVGMVAGAGWAGVRAMTATSGPGVSLMGEIAGLMYFAEVPGVVIDVERLGPSTGLPTRTAQGDILQVAFLSHGDTQHVMLWPSTPEECFEFTQTAFDLAEELQAPVFVMTDLDLGMNIWESEPFRYPEEPPLRGKVLAGADLDRIQKFSRYKDVDGDGIPYRTLPGDPHPKAAYFTRGSGHNEDAIYTESNEAYKRLVDRLRRKYETARGMVPKPVVDRTEGAEIGLVAFGSTDLVIRECRDHLLREGVRASYLRLRAVPFTEEVFDFVRAHERVYVIEQNRDGQMCQLLRLDLDPSETAKLRSVRHYDGLPVDARSIAVDLLAQERKDLVHAGR